MAFAALAAGVIAVLSTFAALAHAQPADPKPAPVSPLTAMEAYLDRPGLRTLLAEHLAARLKSAPQEERGPIAERLGKLYVSFIATGTPAERKEWEERARELLRVVPEVKSYELRLDLARTVYSKAEEAAERWRLRLGTEEEKAEAERSLRGLKGQFESVASDAGRRVDALERTEDSGKATDQTTEDLSDARRIRSIAQYFAGWTSYYIAFLSHSDSAATDALKSFGGLLGAGAGRTAALDRLPKSMLKYDHLARAAIGVALANALRRDGDTEGLRWLDVIDQESQLPEGVRAQLFTRRLTILASAKRWADVETLVRAARNSDRAGKGENVRLLEPLAARLLAVLCFESDARAAVEIVERLGQIAMADLVARGEVGHVLDLAQRFGTSPLGDTGFIVHYVRGVQAYEKAVKAHEAALKGTGTPAGTAEPVKPHAADEPTRDPALVVAFRAAAAQLDAAGTQDDAGAFPTERARSLVMAGRSLFRAGDLVRAAERFSQASAGLIADPAAGEEALWLAIVALDRAVRDHVGGDADVRLDELCTLFLRQFPSTERAANLLVRRAAIGGIDDEKAVSTLLSVPAESPVYASARRQAARVLYRLFRAAPESGRGFAAGRFVKVADEIAAIDRRDAIEGDRAKSIDATERLVLLSRQMLDALLTSATPDAARAEAVLESLRKVVAFNGSDISAYQAEFTFRTLQVLLAKEDGPAAEKVANELRAGGGRFADAADRLLFQRAVTRWRRATAPDVLAKDAAAALDAASPVFRLGSGLIDRMGAGPGALQDAAVQTLYRHVAQAGAELWIGRKDTAARDLAIKLDRAILAAVPGTIDSLTRLATLSEAAGDSTTALECWRTLASGHKPGTADWFRAKFDLARLLADRDAPKALDVLEQLAVLYPDYGPEPTRAKLRALHDRLKAGAPAAPTAPTSPPTPGSAPAVPGGTP